MCMTACEKCGGTGYRLATAPKLARLIRAEAPCETCHGSGAVIEQRKSEAKAK